MNHFTAKRVKMKMVKNEFCIWNIILMFFHLRLKISSYYNFETPIVHTQLWMAMECWRIFARHSEIVFFYLCQLSHLSSISRLSFNIFWQGGVRSKKEEEKSRVSKNLSLQERHTNLRKLLFKRELSVFL